MLRTFPVWFCKHLWYPAQLKIPIPIPDFLIYTTYIFYIDYLLNIIVHSHFTNNIIWFIYFTQLGSYLCLHFSFFKCCWYLRYFDKRWPVFDCVLKYLITKTQCSNNTSCFIKKGASIVSILTLHLVFIYIHFYTCIGWMCLFQFTH